MTLSAEEAIFRSTWREGWLSSIQKLADLEMQRATWLNPQIENPHYSFVEFVQSYFDLALSKEDGGYSARVAENLLSQDEAAVVSYFHDLLENYRPADWYDHEAILMDPIWHRVVDAAKDARARLETLTDAGERVV